MLSIICGLSLAKTKGLQTQVRSNLWHQGHKQHILCPGDARPSNCVVRDLTLIYQICSRPSVFSM